jgi:hypothetical protein
MGGRNKPLDAAYTLGRDATQVPGREKGRLPDEFFAITDCTNLGRSSLIAIENSSHDAARDTIPSSKRKELYGDDRNA